jgi:hypothetical protein
MIKPPGTLLNCLKTEPLHAGMPVDMLIPSQHHILLSNVLHQECHLSAGVACHAATLPNMIQVLAEGFSAETLRSSNRTLHGPLIPPRLEGFLATAQQDIGTIAAALLDAGMLPISVFKTLIRWSYGFYC